MIQVSEADSAHLAAMAMRAFPQDVAVVLPAVSTLGNLAEAPEHLEAVELEGSGQLVAAAMRAFPQDAELQEAALFLLTSFSEHEFHREALIEDRVVSAGNTKAFRAFCATHMNSANSLWPISK